MTDTSDDNSTPKQKNEGYIYLHRKLRKHVVAGNLELLGLWTYILLTANHTSKVLIWEGEVIKIERGSFVTSILGLSEKFSVCRKKISKLLNLIQKEGGITQKRDNRKTIITVRNYDRYQTDFRSLVPTAAPTAEQLRDNCGATAAPLLINDKEMKINEKNENSRGPVLTNGSNSQNSQQPIQNPKPNPSQPVFVPPQSRPRQNPPRDPGYRHVPSVADTDAWIEKMITDSNKNK